MKFGNIVSIIITAVISLLLAEFVAGYMKREVLIDIPSEFIGIWQDTEDNKTMAVSENGLILTIEDSQLECNSQEVVIYYDGASPLSYLFGEKKLAVSCDERSTVLSQYESEIIPPTDYRKTFYFSYPERSKFIVVDESRYLDTLYDGGPAEVIFPTGLFTKF